MTTITRTPQTKQASSDSSSPNTKTPQHELQVKELAKRAILSAYEDPKIPRNRIAREVGGIVGGVSSMIIAQSTGASVGLHEFIGHGILGLGLTGDNSSATYQTNGWDRFTQLSHSSSFEGGIENFFKWLFSVDSGQLGVTNYNQSTPNGLGIAMGPEGRSAWISIAGSIPGLLVDSASVAGGMILRKKSPILGNLFVLFGLADSVTASNYAIGAATMSRGQLSQAAHQGHDFANFALKMSDITGMPATDIAITTATLWTLVVPLIAIASYMKTKSHITDAVPDILALREWIQDDKNKEKINTYWEAYCTAQKNKKDAPAPQLYGFVNDLLNKISSSELSPYKTKLLTSWNKNIPTDRIQTGLNITASLGMITSIATKILSTLSLAHPGLEATTTALSYAAPVLVGAAIASAAYQVYKDFKCNDSVIPQKAKMISIAKLIVTIASAIFIIISLFQPASLNFTFPIALFSGALINTGLSFARAKIVQNQYALHTANSDAVKELMLPLWEAHQKNNVDQPMPQALEKWAKLAKPKPKQESLSEQSA